MSHDKPTHIKNRQWKNAAEAHGGKFKDAVEDSHDAVKAGKDEKERLHNFMTKFNKNSQLMLDHGATVEDFFAALQHTNANAAVIIDGIKNGIPE